MTKYKPGDWYYLKYGFEHREFYIDKVLPDGTIVLGCPKWCYTDTLVVSQKELQDMYPIYVGRGKKKWYWFLIKWLTIFHPYRRVSES